MSWWIEELPAGNKELSRRAPVSYTLPAGDDSPSWRLVAARLSSAIRFDVSLRGKDHGERWQRTIAELCFVEIVATKAVDDNPWMSSRMGKWKLADIIKFQRRCYQEPDAAGFARWRRWEWAESSAGEGASGRLEMGDFMGV